MKIFYAESAIDYASYTFPYGVYCVAESMDEFPEIYEHGFLPYTDRTELDESVLYKARSLRVRLENLTSTSENRRTDRKMEELGLKTEWIDIEDFDINNSTFRNLCEKYTAARFKNGQMSSVRLDYVLNHDLASQIWTCAIQDKVIGYVFLSTHGNMVHYWYAFMSLDYLDDYPIGKWMMWNVLKEAQGKGFKYCYLGTCYGNHSLYKVRDHNAIEYYDGLGWNQDKKLLKNLCKSDGDRGVKDAFKLSESPEEFLK